jgi:hypothetical protein
VLPSSWMTTVFLAFVRKFDGLVAVGQRNDGIALMRAITSLSNRCLLKEERENEFFISFSLFILCDCRVARDSHRWYIERSLAAIQPTRPDRP